MADDINQFYEENSVAYGGVPIHLEDPSYELHWWLTRALSIPGNDLFAGIPLGVSSPEAPWGCPVGSRLERTNWPVKDPPLLNSLQWPVTGATRFARGLWLFGGDGWDKIKEDLDKTSPHRPLTFSDGVGKSWGGGREVEMYALRPRRVQPTGVEGQALWIVPLVDARYLWQFRPVELSCDKDTTWLTLLTQINTALGLDSETDIEFSPASIDSEYGNPDPGTWDGRIEIAPALIDAIAASLGRRFVATTASIYTIVTPEEALSDSNAFIEAGRPKLAGDDADTSGFTFPKKLWTVFPPYKNGVPIPDDETPTVVETELEQFKTTGEFWTETDSTHLIRSTYFAEIDPTGDPGDPALNLTTLEALADKLGEALVKWLELQYEYSFHGVGHEWVGCGFDDTITIEFGTLNPLPFQSRLLPGAYRARTHVKTLPPNCLPTMNYSQEPAEDLTGCPGGGGSGTLYGIELDTELLYTESVGYGDIIKTWLGDIPANLTHVTLHNPEVKAAGEYMFAGTIGRMGLAVLANPEEGDPSYTLIQIECAAAEESGKVKVDITGTARYLDQQWIDDSLTYNPSLHNVVYFENTGLDSMRAFFVKLTGSDELVGVDVSDSSPGYLTDKIASFTTPVTPIAVRWQNHSSYITAFIEQGDLPANTDEKVKVTSGDVSGSEYLSDKFDDTDTYNPTIHNLVYFTTLTDSMRAFTAKQDDRLVAADSGDSSPSTLDNKIANPSTYVPATHQLVYQEVSGATVQLFTDKFSGADLDEKVKATSSDPSAGYLDTKLTPGGTWTGGMITVQWDVFSPSLVMAFIDPADLPADSDKFVMVSATDSGGSAYLEDQVTPKGSPVAGAVAVSFNSDGNVISAWFDPDDLPVSEDRLVAVQVGDSGGTLDSKLAPFGSPGSGALAVTFENNGTSVSAFVEETELPPDSDEKVSVRSGDTPGYLENQVSPVDAEIGGAVQVHFDSNGSVITAWVDPSDISEGTDIFVAVSSADSAGYLEDQVTLGGSPILGATTVWFNSDSYTISAWCDSIVKVSSTDPSAGYLDSKFYPIAALPTGTGVISVYFVSSGTGIQAAIDLKDIGGYNPAAKQVLINNNGSIGWQDVVTKDVVRHVDFILGTGFVYYTAEIEVISSTDDPTPVTWETGGPC